MSCCNDAQPCDPLDVNSANLGELSLVRGVNNTGCEKYEDPTHLLCRQLESMPVDSNPSIFGSTKFIGPDCKAHPLPTPAAETPLTVVDSSTVNLSNSGTADHTLTANVIVSSAIGNQLQVTPEGLFVAPDVEAAETPITPVDSTSVDLSVSGVDNHTLTAAVKVSAAAGNQVQINSDGIFVPQDIDQPITPVDTSTVDLSVSGAGSHTLAADVKISGQAGNQIVALPDGLFVAADVDPVPPQTPIIPVDSSTLDLSVSGVDNHTLTGVVKISAASGNQVQANADGLFVPPAATVNVCAQMQQYPSGGALTPGDKVVVVDALGNACQLKDVQAAAGDNWGAQVVQHDNTLLGSGTAADPLKVASCPVIQGVPDSTTPVQTGDKIVVKTPTGCETRPMPAASSGAIVTDCGFSGDGTSGAPLKINQNAWQMGSTKLPSDGAVYGPTTNLPVDGQIIGNTIQRVITAPGTCAIRAIVTVVFGPVWYQITPNNNAGASGGGTYQADFGSGYVDVAYVSDDAEDDQEDTSGNLMLNGTDREGDPFTTQRVINIPAGGSVTIRARTRVLVSAAGTISMAGNEDAQITYITMPA